MHSPPEASRGAECGVSACDECLRRTRLFELLAPHLERARHERRLGQVLALDEEQLIAAIGGQRRAALRAAIAQFEPAEARVRLKAASVVALCRHGHGYPSRLLAAEDAPAVLHVAGPVAGLKGLSRDGALAVAIVGARRASGYGLETARALGRGLAAAGLPVVSGMALGIDAAAHAGALEAGGTTIAVLAGGADLPYPASKAPLYRRIVSGPGCAVSEMPPGFRPFKWGFPARNRVIAGLADATIIVEAARRSGSLITAELAQELGRLVAAVPGPVTAPMSEGTNSLLRDGAELIRDAQDMLDALLGAGVAVIARGPDPASLPADLRRIVERVGSGPATPSSLLGPDDDVDAVVGALSELEMMGFLRRGAGGGFVRVAS